MAIKRPDEGLPPDHEKTVKPKGGTTPGGTPKPIWTMPVEFKGTVKVGTRRSVLLQRKADQVIIQKFEGDTLLGMRIVEIRPTSVILENDKRELFEFRDKVRDDHGL